MTMGRKLTKEEIAQFHAETEAWIDWARRVERRDPDLGFYMPGEPRRVVSWWRRLLKIPLPDEPITRHRMVK